MYKGMSRFDGEDVRRRSQMETWLARRILAGWTPRAVAAASAGRMNVRTAYRWRAELVRLDTVIVAGYAATFAIRRTKPPLRISEWERLDA